MTNEPETTLSDLAMRILCSLPKEPVVVTQNEIRADITMDTGQAHHVKISEALKEIDCAFGLFRNPIDAGYGTRRSQGYGLLAAGWARAQSVGQAWWKRSMVKGVRP